MSRWGELFLAVIAISSLATSIVLIALLVTAARLAKRIEGLTRQIEQEMKPAFGHLNAIARDAARAASLAALQVERIDSLFTNLVQRAEDTVATVQGVFSGPIGKGSAVSAGMAAFRAVLDAIRDARAARARRRKDDEDALFI